MSSWFCFKVCDQSLYLLVRVKVLQPFSCDAVVSALIQIALQRLTNDNNIAHEHFAIEEVISDEIFRATPITIAGYKFKFLKLSSSLLGFGIRKGNGIRFSDPEKTVLDFIYLWRYNGVPDEKIVADVSEWAKNVSKEKTKRYAKKYPNTVAEIAERVI